MSVLQEEDLVGLTASIWEAMLGRDVEPVSGDAVASTGFTVSGCVAITGEWTGSVEIILSQPAALRAAADMFAMEQEELDDDLVNDAVGELANVAAGNIKGMIPADTKLGLPTVVRGNDYHISIPGTRVVCAASFLCDGEPIRVLVQSPTDLPVTG